MLRRTVTFFGFVPGTTLQHSLVVVGTDAEETAVLSHRGVATTGASCGGLGLWGRLGS